MAKNTRKDEHHFSCPVINDQEVTNESGESFEDLYGKVSRNITTDKEQFLKSFRTAKYDGWGKTYNDVKESMKPFKSKYFCPHYKPGMKIYESACGIGLNLFMTVEILQECQQQTRGGFKDVNGTDDDNNIFVYGNEYVRESVERSEMILGEGILPAGATRGVVCTGDSTNLSHVPSNVFDLVYSGYITPIQDPLDIGLADGWKKYQDLCNALQNRTGTDWMGQELWNAAVKRQRDWYGKWVEEMARIAKPGAPVIVEQVSVSWCAYQNDWGGVDPIFWFEAGAENTYKWNIDQNSIKIMEDTIHEHRYHVVMVKKKADE